MPRMSRSEAGMLGYLKTAEHFAKRHKDQEAAARLRAAGRTCKHCGSPIPYEKRENSFCSHSCSATYSNTRRVKPRPCPICSKPFVSHGRIQTCSVRCGNELKYTRFIEGWLAGTIVGGTWASVCRPVRRWLIEKYGEHCSLCGWAEHHPVTSKIPLQVDHVDGNGNNHVPGNLRLLCPNCHSLTPTYCGLNRGNGRADRRARYLSVKSTR